LHIPGGCTGILQPADVSWNRPFKAHIQESYDEWLFSGERSFTPKGNRRAPPLSTFLRWIKEAWDKITPEIIKKSFLKCGISNALDGADDHLLFAESDSDSEAEFEGFTAEDIEDAGEVAENMATTRFDLDSSSQSEDSSESECEDPASPGH
jgi:hypothetical protein